MRTTVTLDDELLAKAREAMGITERSVLLHEGLKLIVQREAARRRHRAGFEAATATPIRTRTGPRHPPRQVAMLLVDTSVWSDQLRRHDAAMALHLEAG